MKTIGEKCRAALLIAAATATALAFASGAQAQGGPNGGPNSNDNVWPYAQTFKPPVLAVVGDIACQPGAEGPGEATNEVCSDPATPPPYTSFSLWQSQEATAGQIEAMKPDAVALLGDLQYQVGRYSDFEQSFDLTYGAFKFLHRPAPGNHEFYDEHGETGVGGYGYFAYYNGFLIDTSGDATTGQPITTVISDPCPVPSASCKAGKTPVADLVAQPVPRSDGQAGHFEQTGGLETAIIPAGGPVGVGDGWYSYNMGGWHIISLNIECYTQPGGCSAMGSWFAAELAWLKKDLQENQSACTAAYWHQPLFSPDNGITQEGATSQAFWELLYQYGADLVLNGHDHLYARYRPLDPNGNFDPRNGIREFVVGTGGETLDTPVVTDTTTADPTGNPNFNALNMQSYTGNYWGVMSLTLLPNGYEWNFTPALTLPGASGPFQDQGFATCHGGPFHGGFGGGFGGPGPEGR